MDKIVECVPNFSEGRRANVVDEIVRAMMLQGVKILDREMDANHNRSVVTLAGAPGAIEEAVFRGIATAARLIDLDAHRGQHPRIGATDVVPFVPIRDVTMGGCVAMARRLGERVAAHVGTLARSLGEGERAAALRRELATGRLDEWRAGREERAAELSGLDAERDEVVRRHETASYADRGRRHATRGRGR